MEEKKGLCRCLHQLMSACQKVVGYVKELLDQREKLQNLSDNL